MNPVKKYFKEKLYGTTWQLKYFSENNEIPVEAIVIKELNRIDDLFSHYKNNSLTSLINDNKIAYKDADEEWKKN